MPELHGILVVDKPAKMTSAEVVARARHALRKLGGKKAGHTGTLDPLATGVLPLVFGEATKLATYLLADEKAYEAELVLGVETDTLDADGAITARAEDAAARVTEDDLRAALARFTGVIEQVPPMYSAIKHEGRPLHALAREGTEVDRAARTVTIHRLDLLAMTPPEAPGAPRARVAVDCSKGTYVRTLVADLGAALGGGAHLGALRRTGAGRFTLAGAVAFADLAARPDEALAHLIRPADALGLPSITIADDHHRAIFDGRIPAAVAADPALQPANTGESRMIQLVTAAGDLAALLIVDATGPTLIRVFTYGLTPDARSRKVLRLNVTLENDGRDVGPHDGDAPAGD